ncbi:hypothetical protein QN362_05345 [Actimicrobium sp. CCC2.4]|nr:hypothetical protein [Actimicrobium sp. CCC2.4]MEB0134751.1 hypothetical protein [Actimicrobium sp. CCC2.4]WPX30690.1 hypothetical protein RHM62_10430 [Actimicrobium sp. CCC2.4]
MTGKRLKKPAALLWREGKNARWRSVIGGPFDRPFSGRPVSRCPVSGRWQA